MSAVSVVIPNYNGKHLLAKHLPAVLEAMRAGDELIVIDDNSTDESWEWLQTYFSTKDCTEERKNYFTKISFRGCMCEGTWREGSKKGDVVLLKNEHNQRFAMSCNLAVDRASRPLIFLINTDVSPHPLTIQELVKNFDDPTVFAVGCLEHEKTEDGTDVQGGKNVLRFARGMFSHNRADSFESGPTAWVSGGSGMFDRQKWIELGGFDSDYYPAYWEDVDLSFRARKRGWKVLFEANAEVDHNHESTNTTAFGQKKMIKMSWQHAQTFVVKNGTWQQKLQYLLWQPYWWIKGPVLSPLQLQLVMAALIILVASALRLYQLAEVPHGMTWDEAAIGYNGWSVATTGRDEWLRKLPISFKSFGDYKAPLAIYVVGGFTRLFGLTLLAVRLPFALSGIAAVIGMMALVKLTWEAWIPKKVPRPFPVLEASSAALLAGALMAVSPWHIHFSRIGFESGMALNFLIWGVVAVLYLLTHQYSPTQSALQRLFRGAVAFFAALAFACSLYTYHSSKIVVPLLVVTLALFFKKRLLKHWQGAATWCFLLAVFITPLLLDTFFGNGGDRFQQASIFRLKLHPIEIIGKLFSHFLVHFDPRFLVLGKVDSLRHGDGQFGILLLGELFLVGVALVGALTRWLNQRAIVPSRLFFFGVSWVLIGILPAAIGVDVPHSNRMLLALPGFILLAVLGWQRIAEAFQGRLVAPAILGMTLLLQLFLTVSYLNHYYTVFAQASADDFIDGYLETVEYVKKLEPDADTILFTTSYQQPYIYTLIGRRTSVYDYHNGSLIKYLFSDVVSKGDLTRSNAVIVATPDQIDPELATHTVTGSDGKVRFVIVKTP